MLEALRETLGTALPQGWSVRDVHPAGARLRVVLCAPPGDSVAFSVRAGVERAGPFDRGGASIAYERTDVPFRTLEPAGHAVAAALEALASAGGGEADLASWVRRALAPGAPGSDRSRGSTQGGRDVTVRVSASGGSADEPDLSHVRQLCLTLMDGDTSQAGVDALWHHVRRARAAQVGEIVIHAPAAVAARLTELRPDPPGTGPSLTFMLRGRCANDSQAAALAAHAAAAVELGAGRVILVHVIDKAGCASTPALVHACARSLDGQRIQVVVAALPFDGRPSVYAANAPRLEQVRPALAIAAAEASRLGVELVVAPGAGLPACVLPPELRPGPDHARRVLSLPGHVEPAYAEVCVACALRPDCRGVQQAWLEAFGADALRPEVGDTAGSDPSVGWQQRARGLLVDQLGTSIALTDVLAASALPAIPCVLPWTAFEHSPGGASGPCCANYQSRPQLAARGADHRTLWNGPDMQAFRRAMATEEQPSTCAASCPILRGGGQRLDQLRLHGGPEPVVAAQLRTVEDILTGREIVRGGPLELRFATTTFCNYDCLMCSYGELGTLEDEADGAFYEAVEELLPELLVLEALGGEPLASPRFRRFLEETPFERYPQLGIALITNASYLTPKQLERLRHVPLSDLTISINAATPDSYLKVNRGLEWSRIRGHLDAVLEARRRGGLDTAVKYSMVILRANLDEIGAFAELAWGDGVDVRFRLPNDDRNGQSIMTDRALMAAALAALEQVSQRAWERGAGTATRELLGVARVLAQRLEDDVVAVLR